MQPPYSRSATREQAVFCFALSEEINNMKKLLIRAAVVVVSVFLLSLLKASPAYADTSHCGTIGNETWSPAGGVHIVTCDVTVGPGATLTIEPGAIVKFPYLGSLNVNGTLIAVGTSGNRIYFTSIRDDATGGDTNGDGSASSPAKGDWSRVVFGAGSSATLDYVTIRYGGSVWPFFQAALYSAGYVIPLVGNNVVLTNNGINGIEIPGGALSVASLTLPYYPAATYYIGGSLIIPAGATMTVEPGAILKFADSWGGLVVNGTLTAIGTSGNRIYFTSVKDDIGGDTNGDGLASAPAKNAWGYVEFGAGSSATLDYLTIRYSGGYGLPRAALYAAGYAIPVVGNNVSLTNNWANGIEIAGGTLPIASLTLPYYPAAAYFIQSSLTIPNGAAMTVEPGAIVKFPHWAVGLTVNGTLTAVGTSSNRIYFTSSQDDAVGGDTNGDGLASSPAAGDWEWVEFGASSSATLDYLTVRYGGGYGNDIRGALYAKGNTLPLVGDNVVLTNNRRNAIEMPGGALATTSFTFPDSPVPYYISGDMTINSGATVTITSGAILKFGIESRLIINGQLTAIGTNDSRIYFTSLKDDSVGGDTNGDGLASTPAKKDWGYVEFGAGSSATLDYLTVRYSGRIWETHAALYAKGYTSIPVVGDNVTLTNNWINGIEIPGGILSATPVTIPYYPATAYYMRDDLTIPEGATLVISPGTVIKTDSANALIVEGALRVLGTASNPVYFTSLSDDSVGGDTDGQTATPVPADWAGIKFQDSSDDVLSLIDYAVIRYGGWNGYGAITLVNASPTIQNTSITQSYWYGISTSNSTPTLICNSIYNNVADGLRNSTTSVIVSAKNQWWGSTSGPYHPTANPSGTGNRVSNGVEFIPWRTTACGDPSNLVATAVSGTQVNLTWQDNSAGESDFHIERYGSTGWTQIGAVGANITNYSDTTLSCGNTYYYRVRAHWHSESWYSGYSNVASATIIGQLCSPSSLTTTVVSLAQGNLTWQDNSPDESDFHVEHSPNGSTSWTEIITVGANITNTAVSLNCSISNYYRVRAHRHSDDQFSLYSNVVSVICSPSSQVATPASRTQITFSWQDNSPDESDFHIERSLNGNTGWSQIAMVGVNVTNYTDSGLNCGTTYYYRVRAHRHLDDLYSGYSNVTNATTLPCLKVYLPMVKR